MTAAWKMAQRRKHTHEFTDGSCTVLYSQEAGLTDAAKDEANSTATGLTEAARAEA